MYIHNQQIDIHVFGGNATSSLTSSIYCLTRSLLAVGILIGFAYGGLTGEAHSPHTQEILFSIFCSLAVSVSHHLSRSSSDPTVILSLIKRQLLVPPPAAELSEEHPSNTGLPERKKKRDQSLDAKEAKDIPSKEKANTEKDIGSNTGKSEENIPSPTKSAAESNSSATNNAKSEDPLPKKLCDTVYARLKSDAIVCVAVAIITFFLHWSGFFRLLQPNLNYVLWVVAVVTGFLLHYALPQLRKQLPWLCFSHPVLKSREYGQFEVCLCTNDFRMAPNLAGIHI